MNESYAQDLCRLLLLRDMGVVCVQTCNCAIEFGAVVVEKGNPEEFGYDPD